MIAQARLGPGRIHHAMRAVGMAERALALMVDRSQRRVAFDKHLSDQSSVQDLIAQSRIEIEQTRLLVLKTAWLIDQHGAKGARTEISAIKVAAPAMATRVIERAIEIFGAAGVSDDTPLAYFYAWARCLRIVDGPDAVHRRTIAREEFKKLEAAPLNFQLLLSFGLDPSILGHEEFRERSVVATRTDLEDPIGTSRAPRFR